MQHTHDQGGGSSPKSWDRQLTFLLDTVRAIRDSGRHYFFLGGGSDSNDLVMERLNQEHSDPASEYLLREVPLTFGDIQTSQDTAIVSIAQGRVRLTQGGGDLFIVATAFPYGDKTDPRSVWLSCQVTDGKILEQLVSRLREDPSLLSMFFGVFYPAFTRGEMWISDRQRVHFVRGMFQQNEYTQKMEFARSSSRR